MEFPELALPWTTTPLTGAVHLATRGCGCASRDRAERANTRLVSVPKACKRGVHGCATNGSWHIHVSWLAFGTWVATVSHSGRSTTAWAGGRVRNDASTSSDESSDQLFHLEQQKKGDVWVPSYLYYYYIIPTRKSTTDVSHDECHRFCEPASLVDPIVTSNDEVGKCVRAVARKSSIFKFNPLLFSHHINK